MRKCPWLGAVLCMITFLSRHLGAGVGSWWCRPHWRAGTPPAGRRPQSDRPGGRAAPPSSGGRTRSRGSPGRPTPWRLERNMYDIIVSFVWREEWLLCYIKIWGKDPKSYGLSIFDMILLVITGCTWSVGQIGEDLGQNAGILLALGNHIHRHLGIRI